MNGGWAVSAREGLGARHHHPDRKLVGAASWRCWTARRSPQLPGHFGPGAFEGAPPIDKRHRPDQALFAALLKPRRCPPAPPALEGKLTPPAAEQPSPA